MATTTTDASVYIPSNPTLDRVRKAARGCEACPLHETGTQTVFGAGRAGARLMLVGEQPGDKEDQAGKPFVGPSGRILDRALEAAGIERDDAYVTNVVKHFKWEPKGKRRIHKKPNAAEIRACRPWLETEMELVHPEVVVALGATAAQALIARTFKVTEHRGEFVEWEHEPLITATVHPSSIVRIREEGARRAEEERFVADLELVARRLG